MPKSEIDSNGRSLMKTLSLVIVFTSMLGGVLTYFFVSQSAQDNVTAAVSGRVGCTETDMKHLSEQSRTTAVTVEAVRASVQSLTSDVREVKVRQEATNKFLDERFSDLKQQLTRLESK